MHIDQFIHGEMHVLYRVLPALITPPLCLCVQAAGAEGAASPPEGGAEGPAAAQQQAAGAEGADLPTLRAGDHCESHTPPLPSADPGAGMP